MHFFLDRQGRHVYRRGKGRREECSLFRIRRGNEEMRRRRKRMQVERYILFLRAVHIRYAAVDVEVQVQRQGTEGGSKLNKVIFVQL